MENIQKYEVLRMIERDGRCHISLDCVEGTLLIYRVQRGDVLEKNLVFDWFRQLVQQLELFYRSGAGRYYRYLNPYSVLVTVDEKIMLLDMEAQSNDFVIRNMQKRAMRNHFVKPVMQIRDDTKMAADLFGLGKTIQFTLACTEVHPSLTPVEEFRLSKIIQKCIVADPQKRYQDLRQTLKDIPKGRKQNQGIVFDKRVLLSAAVLVIICIVAVRMFTMENASAEPEKEENVQDTYGELDAGEVAVQDEEPVELGKEAPEDGMESLRQAFLENTKEGNEMVISEGERLKDEILYYLALAYDREGQCDAAILTYEMLCESQSTDIVLEQAFYRKAILERENEQLEQAKATCESGLEKFPESQKLQEVLEELKEAETNEEEFENGTAQEAGVEITAENDDAE